MHKYKKLDKVEDEIIPNTVDENLITDDSEKPTQENDNIISEPNDKLTSEPTEEIAELKDDKKETKIDILNQNSIIPDNNNNNPLKINTNLSNNIPKKDNISSNENKQIEILENDNNSISSLPKDTIKNEPKMLLNQSPELNSFEVVGSLKNDKINNPDQTAKSSIINYSEILCHSQNDKITEQPQSILYNSPQQNYSEIMCNSPEEEESSPHNLLCSSPQTSYSEMLCESPIDEYNNDNHTVCNSPEGTYSEMICESPVDELPKDDFDTHSMLFTSPEQKFSEQVIQSSLEQKLSDHTAQSSPETRPKAVRKSTGYSFNSIEALVGNFSFQNREKRESTPLSNHDKDHIYSQLKMTELSKRTDNSLQMSSILGSCKY